MKIYKTVINDNTEHLNRASLPGNPEVNHADHPNIIYRENRPIFIPFILHTSNTATACNDVASTLRYNSKLMDKTDEPGIRYVTIR